MNIKMVQKKIKMICGECQYEFSVLPDKKYDVCFKCHTKNVNDKDFFNPISSSHEAYLLGLLFQCGVNQDNSALIKLKLENKNVLSRINKLVFGNSLFIHVNDTHCSINIGDKAYSNYKNLDVTDFDQLLSDSLFRHFVRGFIESNAYINDKPFAKFSSKSNDLLTYIITRLNIVSSVEKHNNKYEFVLSCDKLLDFLDLLYKDSKSEIYTSKMFDFYKKLCTAYVYSNEFNAFKWVKLDENAVAPFKERASDSGYDLTLLKSIKRNGSVEFFDTGIAIEPPFGYYFDLVGRSSISKSGYILANNMGVIDRSYRGSIIVPLIKIDSTKPDITLPCRLVQIIPRQIHHLQSIQVDSLSDTSRGSGGFGSSNKQ